MTNLADIAERILNNLIDADDGLYTRDNESVLNLAADAFKLSSDHYNTLAGLLDICCEEDEFVNEDPVQVAVDFAVDNGYLT